MTNRQLIYLVRDQKPLVLASSDCVRNACKLMWERRTGSVLVTDCAGCLVGIFTGRDAIRLLANTRDAGAVQLDHAMTRGPVTVSPTDRAAEALRAMCDGGFRHVPVIEGGKAVGVVSRGDFKGMEFEEYCWRHQGQKQGAPSNRAVSEIIHGRRPLMLAPSQTVTEACRTMWQHRAGSVLVADKRQRLVGIFTGRDTVRVLAKVKDAGATSLAKTMTRDPATISPDSHAIDALRVMNDGGFRHLPVVAEGRILGIVTRNDFTGIEIDRLDEEEHLKECIW